MNVTSPRKAATPLLQLAVTCAATGLLLVLARSLGRPAHATYHTPHWVVMLHLLTVLPALPLGAWLLYAPKGDAPHKLLGRIWGTLMLVTAIDSFWIRDLNGGIGPIHAFSVLTLISLPLAVYHIRKGNVEAHLRTMRGLYIGLCAAGLFALMPGRMLGNLLLRRV